MSDGNETVDRNRDAPRHGSVGVRTMALTSRPGFWNICPSARRALVQCTYNACTIPMRLALWMQNFSGL